MTAEQEKDLNNLIKIFTKFVGEKITIENTVQIIEETSIFYKDKSFKIRKEIANLFFPIWRRLEQTEGVGQADIVHKTIHEIILF